MSNWQNWIYERVPSLLAVFTLQRTEPFSLLIPTSTGSKPVFFTMFSIWSSQGMVASRFVSSNSCIKFIIVCFRTWLKEQLCDTLTVLVLAGQQGDGSENLPSIFTCVGHSPCSMLCWPCPTCFLCSLFLPPMIGDTTGVLCDHWVAKLVSWLASTHCTVNGSSFVCIDVCCGGCGFGGSDHCLPGSYGPSS